MQRVASLASTTSLMNDTSSDDSAAPLVLVVDDDELLRLVIREVLEVSGYRVAEADSATASIDFCHATPPDLVLLDALMPDVDGFACCGTLRAHPATQHLPILMLTALNDIDTAAQTRAAGATDYISKPFKTEHLLDRIAHFIPSPTLTP